MRRGPKAMSELLCELMARRGFTRVQASAELEDAWRKAAGPLAAKFTRPGLIRRGTLEVIVATSTLVQELTFQKPMLVRRLTELVPAMNIRNLRFRVGTIDAVTSADD